MARAHRLAGIVATLLLVAPLLPAQQPTAAPVSGAPRAQAPSQAKPPTPTADALGVSIKNIRKHVPEASPSDRPAGNGLRYDFFVDVLGKRPALDFFKDFDLSTKGNVRWGSVTHQEILNAVTPYPFRVYTGGIDLLSIGKKK
jgi:hypothetical protein